MKTTKNYLVPNVVEETIKGERAYNIHNRLGRNIINDILNHTVSRLS